MTKPHTSTSHESTWFRNDDGSLLLSIMFTLVLTGLILVITGTMLAGLNKTRDSRDLATSLQAADTAFADALIRANLNQFSPTAASPQTSGAPKRLGSVTWQWTATRTSTRTWNIAVETQGESTDRNYTATLRGVQVQSGILDTRSDSLRYIVSDTENYEFGFFGSAAVTMTGPDTASFPDIDGYSGATGTVGSNGNMALGSTQVPRIVEWKWTTDSGRCTGTSCPTVNGGTGSAKVDRINREAEFDTTDIEEKCATPDPAWNSTTGGPLVANRCYESLLFNGNQPQLANGVVYVKGSVVVNPNLNINVSTASTTAPSSRLRIAALGNFNQGANSKIAMAVFAPNGTCTVDAISTAAGARTMWLGAATCQTLKVNGPARMRYDGGLALVNDNPSTTASGTYIWSVVDFTSVD